MPNVRLGIRYFCILFLVPFLEPPFHSNHFLDCPFHASFLTTSSSSFWEIGFCSFFGKKKNFPKKYATSACCRTDRHVDKRAKKAVRSLVADEGKKTLHGGKISKQGRELEEESMGNRISRPISPHLRPKEEGKETIVVLYFSARSEKIQAPFAFLNNKQNIKKN